MLLTKKTPSRLVASWRLNMPDVSTVLDPVVKMGAHQDEEPRVPDISCIATIFS